MFLGWLVVASSRLLVVAVKMMRMKTRMKTTRKKLVQGMVA
jgi:hypothetical protein